MVELEAQRRLAERLACPSPSPPRPPSRVGTRLQSARSAPARHPTRQRAGVRARERHQRARAAAPHKRRRRWFAHLLQVGARSGRVGLWSLYDTLCEHKTQRLASHHACLSWVWESRKSSRMTWPVTDSFCPRGAQRSAPRPARACPCLASSSRRPKRQSRSRERYTIDGLTLHPFAATRRDRVDVPSSLGPAHDDQADAIDCHRWVNAPSKPLCPPFVVDPRLHP